MRLIVALGILLTTLAVPSAWSQTKPVVPYFWDPQERLLRPDVKDRPRLRFLTVTDFPPFSFIDPRKRLSGFHVELAREICSELELLSVCQIQALPYNELENALNGGEGDALMAGIPITADTRARFEFTRPYFRLPGRFVARKNSGLNEPLAQALAGKTVGIVAGTAHGAYGQSKFAAMQLRLFDTRERALEALSKGAIEAVFDDALSLSFWLLSEPGTACCSFVGGPYLSDDYFGLGLAIAVKKGDQELAGAIDYALRSISDSGKFSELYLRYFPISLY